MGEILRILQPRAGRDELHAVFGAFLIDDGKRPVVHVLERHDAVEVGALHQRVLCLQVFQGAGFAGVEQREAEDGAAGDAEGADPGEDLRLPEHVALPPLPAPDRALSRALSAAD